MTIDADIYPWQVAEWRQLVTLAADDRVPHGLLLAGSGEIGKGHFADQLANLLLCSAPVDGNPCGRCKSCLLYRASSHPDFMGIEPEAAARVIKVDQIRRLGELVSRTASTGQRRVIVINPAEAMNLNAANAFLKTLEEPGRAVVIILVTNQLSGLLPTIRSRCRIIPFALPEGKLVDEWLRQRGHAGERIERALELAGGRPLRALRLIEGDLRTDLELFTTTLEALQNNRLAPLEAAGEIRDLNSADAVEWFQYHVYQKVRAATLAGDIGARLLFRFLDRLGVVRQRLLSTANPNPQLTWEEVLMDWKSVLDLLATQHAGRGGR